MPTDRDIEAFFAAVDASDTEKLGTLLAPTVTLRVNAATPFSGRDAALKALSVSARRSAQSVTTL